MLYTLEFSALKTLINYKDRPVITYSREKEHQTCKLIMKKTKSCYQYKKPIPKTKNLVNQLQIK